MPDRPIANGGFELLQGDRLDSWKEIAAYLKRDVTTVQRWEKKEGLPVHRKIHDKLGSVYAFKNELDAWWEAGQAGNPPVPPPRPGSKFSILTLATLLAASMLGVVAWSWTRSSRGPEGARRIVPFTTLDGSERYPAFSPDGAHIAFTANYEQGPFVYVAMVNGGTPLQVTHARGAQNVAWSPDGTQLAFLRLTPTGRAVFVVPALGGPERRVTTRRSPNPGLAWADNHSVIVVDRESSREPDRLHRVSIETGERTMLTRPATGHGDRLPKLSPDGTNVVFLRTGEIQGVGHVHIASLAGGGEQQVTSLEWAVFDLDWSSDARAIIVAGELNGENRLWRLDVSGGSPVPLPVGENATEVTVARTGRRLAYARLFRDHNIWRVAGPAVPDASTPEKLIASTRQDRMPQYSPDGRHVSFMSDRSGVLSLWVCQSDGGNCRELSRVGTAVSGAVTWSPAGDRVAFARADTIGEPRIYIARLDTGLVVPMEPPLRAIGPGWSADGRSLFVTVIRENERPIDREVWRVPLDGGSPVKARPTEWVRYWRPSLQQGQVLFYDKGTPIPLLFDSGASTTDDRILNQEMMPFEWVRWKGRFYYLMADRDNAWISSADPGTGVMQRIRELGRTNSVSGLSVSSDGAWFLYARNDGLGGDIVLVEDYDRWRIW